MTSLDSLRAVRMHASPKDRRDIDIFLANPGPLSPRLSTIDAFVAEVGLLAAARWNAIIRGPDTAPVLMVG